MRDDEPMSAQDITIAEMRYAAILLERFNELYEGRMYGWTPETLRYESDYLEAHP